MAPSATSTTATTVQQQNQPAVLKLRSDQQQQEPVFPEGTALRDLSRGNNPLTGAK